MNSPNIKHLLHQNLRDALIAKGLQGVELETALAELIALVEKEGQRLRNLKK